jgi:hypothetical protein
LFLWCKTCRRESSSCRVSAALRPGKTATFIDGDGQETAISVVVVSEAERLEDGGGGNVVENVVDKAVKEAVEEAIEVAVEETVEEVQQLQ